MDHLWSAILHQGTPWTATGPVALVLAGILLDAQSHPMPIPVRVALTSFLAGVGDVFAASGATVEELEQLAAHDIDSPLETDDAESLYEDEDSANAIYARAVLGCLSAFPLLTQVMDSGLANSDHRVRMHAAAGAVTLAKAPMGTDRPEALEERLAKMARSAADPDERSTLVLALGDLGVAPTSYLRDSSPAVRMCAALAPALANDEAATAELLSVLEDHAGEIDRWFADRPPQFDMRPRFDVVRALLARVKDFGRLSLAAVAVARVTQKYCVDSDWGPFLVAAFSGSEGVVGSPAQRKYLAALVENRLLWDRTFGNAYAWFKKAGLPYDRVACQSMIGAAEPIDTERLGFWSRLWARKGRQTR